MNQSVDKKSISCKEEVRPSGFTHSFDREIARVCGIEAACIFTHICFWIQQNQMHQINQFEGKTWTYMTYEQISERLGYLSVKQARLGIERLVANGLIIKGDFSKDRFIKPTYYALCNENIIGVSNNSSDVPNRADRSAQIEPSMCPKGQLDVPFRAALLKDKDIRKNTYKNNNTPPIPPHPEPDGSMPAKASEKRKKVLPEDWPSEVLETGQSMIEAMKGTKPDCKEPTLPKFLHSIDLMIRVDKREALKIRRIFQWALSDEFWRDKFFKPDPANYLREKFDQLEAKMNAKAPPSPYKVDRRARDNNGNPIKDEYLDNLF